MAKTPTRRSFLRCEDGVSLVYTLVAMPVMIGILGFTLDISRVMTLNTELQDLADAAAIAGAVELDRLGDDTDTVPNENAIFRAVNAALNTVDNTPRSPNDPTPATQIASITFYDVDRQILVNNALVDAYTDDDARDAFYIGVLASPRTAPALFIRALLPDAQDPQTSAWAVAQNQQVACQVTPLMMCLPNNPAAFSAGKLFALKQQGGNNSSLAPGAFALLDPPGQLTSGAIITEDLLAATEPGFCFVNNLSVATGQRTDAISDGINQRFDIYEKGSPKVGTYPPAKHVAKGLTKPNACGKASQPNDPTKALKPFPLDDCFYTQNCGTLDADGNNRLGNGAWNRQEYFDANHPNPPETPTNLNLMTRYEMYLWEIENVIDENLVWEAQDEKARPTCEPPAASPNRRIIYVAVTDCTNLSGTGPIANSTRYAKFFLIRPSFTYDENGIKGITTKGEIVAEFIDWIDPNDDSGVLKNLVQLVE